MAEEVSEARVRRGGERRSGGNQEGPDEAMKGSHSFASQFTLFAAVVANLRQVRYEWPLMKKKCGSASENNSGGGS